jgi:hypothetical protein
MGFTDIELEFCRTSIKKLLEHPLSNAFLRPVDPELDGVADYLRVITTPMDLSLVNSNLQSGNYSSSAEFVRDIDLVWTNSMTYNKKNRGSLLLSSVAHEMKKKCDTMFLTIPKTEVDLWNRKVAKVNKRMRSLLFSAYPQDSLVPRKAEYSIKKEANASIGRA